MTWECFNIFAETNVQNVFLSQYIPETFFSYAMQNANIIPLLKGALSGLRQFLATESLLKMIKNAFYFTLKAIFILKIFKFLS